MNEAYVGPYMTRLIWLSKTKLTLLNKSTLIKSQTELGLSNNNLSVHFNLTMPIFARSSQN